MPRPAIPVDIQHVEVKYGRADESIWAHRKTGSADERTSVGPDQLERQTLFARLRDGKYSLPT
jgi:hypothetical protein